jgi:hypothetical protein
MDRDVLRPRAIADAEQEGLGDQGGGARERMKIFIFMQERGSGTDSAGGRHRPRQGLGGEWAHSGAATFGDSVWLSLIPAGAVVIRPD